MTYRRAVSKRVHDTLNLGKTNGREGVWDTLCHVSRFIGRFFIILNLIEKEQY